MEHTHHVEGIESPVVLTLPEAADVLRAKHEDEARRWIVTFAPEAIVFYRPLRVSRALLISALARGLRPSMPEVIS